MKNILLIFSMLILSLNVFSQQGETLNLKEFKKAIRHKGVVILDVRTPEEFEDGHIKKAVNVNWKDSVAFSKKVLSLPQRVPVYVYCRTGVRSEQASKWLRTHGFEQVKDLRGGFKDWEKSGNRISKKKH